MLSYTNHFVNGLLNADSNVSSSEEMVYNEIITSLGSIRYLLIKILSFRNDLELITNHNTPTFLY